MVEMEVLPKPYKNKVLVEVWGLEEVTKGGIIVPQLAKDKHRSTKGKIVDVGASCKLELKTGDVVVFEEWAGSRLYINGKDYLFVLEDAVQMVLEED
jgi:chaperonin GroES